MLTSVASCKWKDCHGICKSPIGFWYSLSLLSGECDWKVAIVNVGWVSSNQYGQKTVQSGTPIRKVQRCHITHRQTLLF